MKKLIIILALFQMGCGSVGLGQSSINKIDSIIIYSLSWEVTTPVGLDREQFLEFAATRKKILTDRDTINILIQELQKVLNNQSNDPGDPDIRLACFVYQSDRIIEEYYFNRQKFLFYNGNKFGRSIDLVNLLDACK